MKKDIKTTEYVAKLKDMKLSDASRTRIENNLLEYAGFHSVRVEEDGRSIEQVPQRTSILNLFKSKSMTAAIIAIMLVAGGGTSYAAEGAVPGDFLYTVKTEVNENVKSAFAISNEAEAKLQARLAEERLEEAEELAARGELTAEASADISSRVKAHTDEAHERIDLTEAKGDYESSAVVRANLEGSFRAYADILASLNSSVSGNDGASLVTDIRAYAEATAEAQANATATIETSVAARAAAEATIARADTLITEVTARLERAESKMSAEAHAQAEAKLGEAVNAQAEAKASFRSETYQAAYIAAQTAFRIASEVDTMINSALRVNIDIVTDIEMRQPGDPIPGIDIGVEQDTNSNNRTDINADESAANESDRSNTTDVESDSSTDVEVDTGVTGTDVQAESSVDLNVGATNATDYNSSRSNKSY